MEAVKYFHFFHAYYYYYYVGLGVSLLFNKYKYYFLKKWLTHAMHTSAHEWSYPLQEVCVESYSYQTPPSTVALKSSRHPLHDKVVHVANDHLVWCWRPFLILFIPFFFSITRYPRLPFYDFKTTFQFVTSLYLIQVLLIIFLYEIIYQIKILFQFYPPLIFFYISNLIFNIFYYCYYY